MKDYTKNIWLKSPAASLLSDAKIKYMKDHNTDKCSYDDIIKEALGVYLYGKPRESSEA
jgi:hypothetical protein